jgi:hypothetical protein
MRKKADVRGQKPEVRQKREESSGMHFALLYIGQPVYVGGSFSGKGVDLCGYCRVNNEKMEVLCTFL